MFKLSYIKTFPIAVLVLIAFTTAPILHDVIPHTHGELVHTHTPIPDGVYPDTHQHDPSQPDHDENPIWASLHSAAHHEKKKVLDIISMPASGMEISIAASILWSFVFYILLASLLFDPFRGRYLHRGIAPYRRFR